MVKKKLLSMLVSLTMVVGMFPMMMVSADEETGTFTELQEAIDKSGFVSLEKNYEWQEGDSSIVIDKGFGGIDLNGKTIDAKGNGPIFIIDNHSRLDINPGSGSITGGSAVNGAAFYVNEGCSLNLYGGAVSGNTATGNGGAIYNEGTVKLQSGTTVTKNNAVNGAGIYNAGSLAIDGGNIVNNTASGNGGGIYQAAGASGITLSSSPVIAGSTPDNLYLAEGQVVNCGSTLSTNATVFISSEVSATVTSGFSGSTTEPFYTDAGYEASIQEGEIYLEKSGSGPVVTDPSFAGLSLTLDEGKIGLNVFVDPGTCPVSELEDSQVTFDIPGKGANVQTDTFDSSFTVTTKEGGRTVYGFTCYLSSVQMAEEIATTFTYGDKTIEGTFSVADYIEKYNSAVESLVLPNNPYKTHLVQRLSDYGYFIQPYLSAENGWSFGEEGGYARMANIYNTSYNDATLDTIMNDCSDFKALKNKVGDSISAISLKLELDSTNAAIVTFSMAKTTTKLSVTCEYGGKTYKAYKQEEGKYAIRIPGIAIQDMEQPLTISGTAGESEEVNIQVTPLGYVYYALKNTNSNEQKKTAMASLYFYWYYAERFIGQGGN